MLELVIESSLTNKLGISPANGNFIRLFDMLKDLKEGKETRLSKDFCCNLSMEADSQGFIYVNDSWKYLVTELPAIANKEDFVSFCESFQTWLPESYKKQLSFALSPDVLATLFSRKSMLVFSFCDDILQMISTTPVYGIDISEYQSKVSVREENLRGIEAACLAEAFCKPNVRLTLTNTSYSSYYSAHYQAPSKLELFVKPNYLRFNSFEVRGTEFSLLISRRAVVGSYNSVQAMANILSMLTNPAGVVAAADPVKSWGIHLLYMNGIGLTQTKNVYPVMIDNTSPDSSYYTVLTLPNDDTEFLSAVKEINKDSIYSKHKSVLVKPDANVVRGCKAIYNASKSLKVFVRDDAKRKSDDLAYKNRMFRDYLSHAISLVCIPIFQKEFVIPEYLQKSFDFRMATLDSCYFSAQRGSKRPRHNERYSLLFQRPTRIPSLGEPEWELPNTDFDLKVNTGRVKTFVQQLKDKELTSTTQSRSSLFTREFVEPFLETSPGYYASLDKPAIYGWMLDMDNQEHHRWTYKLASAHLLRSSAPSGYYHAECGLLSDKTFGLKAIMNHVFTKESFSGVNKDYSSTSPGQYVQEPQKAAHISAMIDIFTANFVPNDDVEAAIKSWGRIDYGNLLVRLNQILFLSEESLMLLNTLYKCESYEDLKDCLNFCMPGCLETLDTLGYSKQLRDHVYSMMTYFWETTVAISEEIAKDASTKE